MDRYGPNKSRQLGHFVDREGVATYSNTVLHNRDSITSYIILVAVYSSTTYSLVDLAPMLAPTDNTETAG